VAFSSGQGRLDLGRRSKVSDRNEIVYLQAEGSQTI